MIGCSEQLNKTYNFRKLIFVTSSLRTLLLLVQFKRAPSLIEYVVRHLYFAKTIDGIPHCGERTYCHDVTLIVQIAAVLRTGDDEYRRFPALLGWGGWGSPICRLFICAGCAISDKSQTTTFQSGESMNFPQTATQTSIRFLHNNNLPANRLSFFSEYGN